MPGVDDRFELAPLFQAVGEALRQNQESLNQADPYNGNHGDHMVEIFARAAQAAQDKKDASLAEAMQYAGIQLEQLAHNGSAQVYAHGLKEIAEQLDRYDISLDDLVSYVQEALVEDKGEGQKAEAKGGAKSGDVLKALLSGLASWGQVESGRTSSGGPLDMGSLFEFGLAYMQARQRGGSRAEVLADAAALVSPLGKVPHRYQSGKLAVGAFLEAMKALSVT
jgi:hypothetical protein